VTVVPAVKGSRAMGRTRAIALYKMYSTPPVPHKLATSGILDVVIVVVALVEEAAPNAPPRRNDDSCCCNDKAVVVVDIGLTGRANVLLLLVVTVVVVVAVAAAAVVVANPVAKTVSNKKNSIINQDDARFNKVRIATTT
jgi:hypothetical protein